MSGWDLVIYVLFALWLAALAAVVVAVRKIVSGPIGKTIASGKSLAGSTMTLVDSGKRVVASNRVPIALLTEHIRDISGAVKLEAGSAVFASEPVNFAKLAKLYATIGSVRGGFETFNRFRNRKQNVAIVAAKPPKPSFAEKLGLIPPAARHIAPAMRVVRIALQTHKELRNRGIL